jgi:endonuclease/exonuclease/phosphatase family metal-dependent hydrolase
MTEPGSWREFAWEAVEPGAIEPLCVAGDAPTRLDCRIEGADFRDEAAPAQDELVIWAYNVERGLGLDAQLAAIATDPGMPRPDVLLLSEVDRGCSRTGTLNVAQEYARALGMCYVYGVEFVELPRLWGPGGGRVKDRCEHGNAIISRFPLGNVTLIRHERTRSWHSWTQRLLRLGQPRLGGRVAVSADVHVGDRELRLYVAHFESGRGGSGLRNRDEIRLAQAEELIADASESSTGVVIGGDLNVSGYLESLRDRAVIEPTIEALSAAGYEDAHADISLDDRVTSDSGKVIDVLVGRDVRWGGAGVGPSSTWASLSDHLPIWTRVLL